MRGSIRRVLAMATGCLLAALAYSGSPTPRAHPDRVVFHQEIVRKPEVYIETYVTGYNTVAAQTDRTPCIGAAGTYICGRNDVVACPPLLKLGTTAGSDMCARTVPRANTEAASISTAITTRAAPIRWRVGRR